MTNLLRPEIEKLVDDAARHELRARRAPAGPERDAHQQAATALRHQAARMVADLGTDRFGTSSNRQPE